MERVIPGIQQACSALARGSGGEAARAIMTTDPFPKEHSVRVTTSRGSFVVGAMAKGSGMIEPNMATMLGFITTDAQVPPAMLHRALVESARDTFNAITVDGECSTNDSLFAMASGSSGTAIDEELYPALLDGLLSVSRPLALGIVRGGEGATRVIAVSVYDARTSDEARQVARTIANSPLVKTAVYGSDPNWGRIVMAVGKTFDSSIGPDRVTIRFGDTKVFERGMPVDCDLGALSRYLSQSEVTIGVDLGIGNGAARVWGCDLTEGYIKENAYYTT
jgi:glutamate N-acetyltransferase/amino-acid N-acetyltransferase